MTCVLSKFPIYVLSLLTIPTPGRLMFLFGENLGHLIQEYIVLKHELARQRFYNFHGQPGARLSRDQSVHEKIENKRSWFITLTLPLLFYAPHAHLQALEEVWVDEKVSALVWNRVLGRIYAEWKGFTLYVSNPFLIFQRVIMIIVYAHFQGTVLLSANVALLAIPSMGDKSSVTKLAKCAAYASVFDSLGCIVFGLFLHRHNIIREKRTGFEAVRSILRTLDRPHRVPRQQICSQNPNKWRRWPSCTAFLTLS